MNHARIFSGEETGTEETKPAFNVVIVYDGRSAARGALNVFNGLALQFGDEFEFHCDLWRFDVLGFPQAHEAAARAGDAADLIIISTRCDTDLGASVKTWLDGCVDGKTPGSAALVGLLESHPKLSDVQCRTRQFLQRAARRAGLEFFLQEASFPQTRQELTLEALQERADTVTSVLDGILHQGDPTPRSRTQQ